jgi:hypothetical protein
MPAPDLIREVETALAARDFDRAQTVCALLPPGPEAAALALRLLAARAAAAPESARPALVQDALAAFRARFGEEAVLRDALLFGDVYLLAGLRHEASEFWQRLYRQAPQRSDFARRLGLAELALAMRTRPNDTANVLARWRRALAYLSAAADDESYWPTWAAGRLRVYGVSLDADEGAEARSRVFARLRGLLTFSAEQAEQAGHPATGTALRQLAVELEVDRAASACLHAALRQTGHPASGAGAPLPFGMIWYATLDAPAPARAALTAIVRDALGMAPEGTEESRDPSAPTTGVLLRQWYSRLAPARHALWQGQPEAARKALETICRANGDCRVNPSPARARFHASPAVCDPACPMFDRCNPGYAGLPRPADEMEADAHRLAIRVCLALAGQHACSRPPRFRQAAEEWVRGLGLSRVLGETEAYHEEVLAQVLGLLQMLGSEPESAAELLTTALAATPSDVLKGRLVDRLTDRGIERWNRGEAEVGVQDLRWALQVNRHSARARQELCSILRNLAELYYAEQEIARAAELAAELRERAEESLRLGLDKATFEPLRDWANEHADAWKELAALADDPVALSEAMLRRMGDGE